MKKTSRGTVLFFSSVAALLVALSASMNYRGWQNEKIVVANRDVFQFANCVQIRFGGIQNAIIPGTLAAALAELQKDPIVGGQIIYLRTLLSDRDPWGHSYKYEVSDDGRTFRLWSVGPDGNDSRGRGDDIFCESTLPN